MKRNVHCSLFVYAHVRSVESNIITWHFKVDFRALSKRAESENQRYFRHWSKLATHWWYLACLVNTIQGQMLSKASLLFKSVSFSLSLSTAFFYFYFFCPYNGIQLSPKPILCRIFSFVFHVKRKGIHNTIFAYPSWYMKQKCIR